MAGRLTVHLACQPRQVVDNLDNLDNLQHPGDTKVFLRRFWCLFSSVDSMRGIGRRADGKITGL
jgi:hypothetical protein